MQEFLELLSAPENLIFSISLIIFATLLVMQVTGLGELFEVGDFDVLSGGDSSGFLTTFLAPFFMLFGCLGLLLNNLLSTYFVGLNSALALLTISFLVSGVTSFFLALFMARLITKILPTVESYGLDKEAFVGLAATVASGPIDEAGSFYILVKHSKNGTLKLKAVFPGFSSTLPRGHHVTIKTFDPSSGICEVNLPKDTLT